MIIAMVIYARSVWVGNKLTHRLFIERGSVSTCCKISNFLSLLYPKTRIFFENAKIKKVINAGCFLPCTIWCFTKIGCLTIQLYCQPWRLTIRNKKNLRLKEMPRFFTIVFSLIKHWSKKYPKEIWL